VASQLVPRERIAGCLLGGALGDSLGAPVEFLQLTEIHDRYGPNGIHELDTAYGRVGAITDDTQMALFTAEGLLRAINRHRERGITHVPSVVHHAYLRWLRTQGGHSAAPESEQRLDGWLVSVRELHDRRAPGNTCLSALESGELGSIEAPLNDSKGCGTVMRIAPVGLINAVDPFRLGCELSALTHGHPSGYLAGGYLAAVIHDVVAGTSLQAAAVRRLDELETWPNSEECAGACRNAFALVDAGSPSSDRVAELGEGWVAEEALAIALYCALVTDSFADGVCLAVNHSGDSDSTGAIAGNLLGALGCRSSLPEAWLAQLELRAEIEQLACDLADFYDGVESSRAHDVEIYPGW
jgi:ADP-ribosylglycohydrolase